MFAPGLHETLLRISGAIQVLSEVLENEVAEPRSSDHVLAAVVKVDNR
jgi:hypothetical protein